MSALVSGFDALARRLRAQAVALAKARLAAARTDPARRWRHANLLWPLFTKG